MLRPKLNISRLLLLRMAMIIVCYAITISCNGQHKKLVLVDNGKSDYKIIIPANASEIEKKAGNELQKYLQQIGGVKLPVSGDQAPPGGNEILIGKTNRTNGVNYNQLADDGLLIQTDKHNLILTGGNRKGVLYSVYTFLEDYLGCRKYTSTVSYIPNLTKIEIPSNIHEQEIPSFQYRSVLSTDALDNDYADWHKINYFFEGWGFSAHSFKTLLPPDKYFKDHPEYFALYKGKRVPDAPCLSNPDILQIMVDNLRHEMSTRTPRKYWSVSQNDNGIYCGCDLCTKVYNEEKTQQGTIIRFVNKVADQFPDKIISTLAYQYSVRPPHITRPNKNVLIILATIDAPRNKPIGTDAPVATYRQYITDWGNICNKDQLFIWDYMVQFTGAWAPYPNLYSMQPNIQFFQDNNAGSVLEQGIGDMESEFSGLRSYIACKLLWDSKLNFDDLLDDFLTGYYGKNAAGPIRSYIDAIQAELVAHNRIEMRAHTQPSTAAASYLSLDNIRKYLDIMEPAVKKSKGTAYYDRVLKVILPLHFAQLDITKNTLLGNNRKMAANAASVNTSDAATKEDLDNFVDECNKLGIKYLSEDKKSVADYYTNYKTQLGN